MKKTYKELGVPSAYRYPMTEQDKVKKITVSNTLGSLNLVNGENNHMKEMLTQINNVGSNVKVIEEKCCYQCENLKSVKIPNPLVAVMDDAFRDCSSLTSLEMNSVFGIGKNAFRNTGLICVDINVRHNTMSGESYDYEGCYENDISTGPYLGDFCFAYNQHLTDVSLCTSTELGNYMFYGCPSLTSVRFANHGQCIGSYAFGNCTSLKSITFPQNFEGISQNMFRDCTQLNQVGIPSDATKFINIESSAFYNCPNLKSITLPSCVNDMHLLDAKAFTGSNVTSINLDGISSSTLDGYVHVVQSNGKFEPIEQYNDYKYGVWYGFTTNEPDENEETQGNFIKTIVNFAKKNGIPLFWTWCSPDCSLCHNLKKMVYTNKDFLQWCANQPYLFCYTDANTREGWKIIHTIDKSRELLPIPCHFKIWFDEKGDKKVYKFYPREGIMHDHADKYISNMKNFISRDFSNYKPVNDFRVIVPIEDEDFTFWDIKNGCKLRSSNGVMYTYDKDNNWLNKDS